MARILHIINRLAIGGAEIMLLEILKHASREEFDYHIMLPYGGGDLDSRAREINVELHYLSGEKYGKRKLLDEGIEKIKSLKPDLINTHTRFSDLVGLYGGMKAGVNNRVMTAHASGMYFLDSKPFHQGLIEMFVVRYAGNYVAVSNSVKDYLAKYGFISPDKITVIHNGIDAAAFQSKAKMSRDTFRKHHGISDDDFVVTSVGRMIPEKGFDHLIREFYLFVQDRKDAKLLLCGNGTYTTELKKIVSSLNMDDITIFIDTSDNLVDLLKASDCFVLSSRKEGFGLVLLEAMASGTPVIGSNVGGIPEIIKHEQNGLMFDLKISGDLSEKISRLQSDPGLAGKLASEGLKTAQENFNIEDTSKKYEELYRKILKIN